MYSRFKFLVHSKIFVPAKYFGWHMKANMLYFFTMLFKKCSYGPFTGEFGHLLGHNLPFIAHLHAKGVKINYCGLEIHKPFFIDDKNTSIVSSYLSLRDFYKEAAPDCNTADVPVDVAGITEKFITVAKQKAYPFWDNSDADYYFNFFRWWVLKKKHSRVYDLAKVFKTRDENSVVIFPRKWNNNFPGHEAAQLRNNGEVWNYNEVAKTAAPYFDKVYVIGHPVFSGVDFSSFDNVEVCLAADNSFILEKCSNSKLIISQHSGTVYLGEYTNTQVLIIFRGSQQIGDIEITKQFKGGLGNKYEFNYAFSLEDINTYLKQL